ncbi:MAG: hypothetical protein CL947_01955 [Epsilonproteobacteria bacterium]|nr:hypothetical protein [Campylobacterota bacterium]|tara:strand:- start:2905 stop:3498 length:594 start_codon:yes stop_codon:yes gene_type:complete
MAAVRYGAIQCVDYILKNYPVIFDIRNSAKQTILNIAYDYTVTAANIWKLLDKHQKTNTAQSFVSNFSQKDFTRISDDPKEALVEGLKLIQIFSQDDLYAFNDYLEKNGPDHLDSAYFNMLRSDLDTSPKDKVTLTLAMAATKYGALRCLTYSIKHHRVDTSLLNNNNQTILDIALHNWRQLYDIWEMLHTYEQTKI